MWFVLWFFVPFLQCVHRKALELYKSEVVDKDDFYWNSLEYYVIEWYLAVEKEINRLKKLVNNKSKGPIRINLADPALNDSE